MNTNCFIIDDENTSIDILATYIKDTPGLTCIGSTNYPLDFLHQPPAQPIDLLFLDIQMPKLNGLQLLKALEPGFAFKVILVTGFTDYGAESYEYNVVDYLLKPVAYARFLKAVEKYKGLTRVGQQAKAVDFIMVKSGSKGQKALIHFEEIEYIESVKNYITFYCANNRQVATNQSLTDMEEALPFNLFSRIHNSFIINNSKIMVIKSDEVILKAGGQRLPISDKYKDGFMKKMEL